MAQVVGKIMKIGQLETISDKFQKLEIVIETQEQDERYNQKIPVVLVNSKTGLIQFYKVGDLVEASVNIRGREWTSPQGEVKYFLTLELWAINLVGKDRGTEKLPSNPLNVNSKQMGNIEANFAEDAIQQMNNDFEDEEDGLPF